MTQRDIFEALRYGLSQSQSVQTPGDVHGTLTGMLCIDNQAAAAGAVDDADSESLTAALDALREMTLAGLFDPDLSFAPLLPDDDTVALGDRVDALARWCAGFVFGLSRDGELQLARLAEDVREIVNDITELSRAALTADDSDAEAAEADYAELVEYVRVGVQTIFMALAPRRDVSSPHETLH